jgi:hypothetical protein
MKKGCPITLPRQRYIGGCTLYGCISTAFCPVYHTAESTNTGSFETFLRKIIQQYNLSKKE